MGISGEGGIDYKKLDRLDLEDSAEGLAAERKRVSVEKQDTAAQESDPSFRKLGDINDSIKELIKATTTGLNLVATTNKEGNTTFTKDQPGNA